VPLGEDTFRQARHFGDQSADGRVLFGQWACEPGSFEVKGNPYLEYCRVIEGQMRTIDPDGTTQVFGPGDSFIIPHGYVGRCDIISTFRKEVVAFSPG